MRHKIPVVAVIGSPIAHSKSPKMHGYWLAQNDIAGHYVPLDVAPDHLETVLRTLPKMGFVGANITIPHKEAALKFADHVTDRAAKIGAANTLFFDADGKIRADNTDGHGFIENLRVGCPTWAPTDGPAMVLGAGGASRAIIVALLEQGAPQVILANRTRARADDLAAEFADDRIRVIDWAAADDAMSDVNTLVNTTSMGMVGNDPLPFDLARLPIDALVTDIVYAPLITPLLNRAQDRGNPWVDGLGMLIYQGIPGFTKWFGATPTVTAELRELLLS